MGRTARDRRDLPSPRPVQKIELSEKHLFLRVAAVILLVTMGIGTIGYALFSMLHVEKGMTAIEANNGSLADVAEEFLFQYDLGRGKLSATTEQKALTLLYGEAARKAYMLFAEREEFDEVINVAYLNRHCNETVQVPKELYQALETCLKDSNRMLYLAPLYGLYSSVFHSREDWEAAMADPLKNAEAMDSLRELMEYVRDPEMVELKLLGKDAVELSVSPEYQKYLQENWEEIYLDFGWTKNAFVIDYMADLLIEGGFTHGSLSSFDGFVRNLDEECEGFEYPVYHLEGNVISPLEPFSYDGAISIVYLRNFPLTELEQGRYYVYSDGETRVPYVDPEDGISKAPDCGILGYSKGRQKGCGELLMEMLWDYFSYADGDAMGNAPFSQSNKYEYRIY